MKKTILTITILSTFGCAQYGNYTPTLDTYNDRNISSINNDLQECKNYAAQSSGGALQQGAIGAGIGGLVGAAGGAIVGAFTGNPAAGAAIGATAGGFGGAGKQSYESDSRYRNAYSQCMAYRGHNVIR